MILISLFSTCLEDYTETQKCIGLFVVSPAWVVDSLGEDIHLGMYVHRKLNL
jgi:hypothetical protein